MENVLLAVIFVVYLAILFLFTTTQATRKTTSARFLMEESTLQTYTTFLSELGTDVGYWLFALLPVAAAALNDNIPATAAVLAVMCLVLLFIHAVFQKRIRIYGEISGSNVTLTDFFVNRFKPSHELAFRLFIGALLTVLPLCAGIGILITAADFLSVVSGWDYLLCVILCSAAVLLCILQTGIVVTFRVGILHSVLLFVAFALLTVFSFVRMDAVSTGWTVLMQNAFVLPTQSTFLTLIQYASCGLCLFGLPTVYLRMMRQKSRQVSKSYHLVYLIMFGINALLVLIPYFRLKSASGNGLFSFMEIAQKIDSPVVSALLFTALVTGMIGAAASFLSCASVSVWHDLIRPLRRHEISVRAERMFSTVIALISCVTALLARSYAMALFCVAICSLSAVLGPSMTFMLTDKRTSPWAVVVSSSVGSLTAIGTYMSFSNVGFAAVLPALFSASLTLFIFNVFTHRANRYVLNEFDRMSLLVRSGVNLFDDVKKADYDEIEKQ